MTKNKKQKPMVVKKERLIQISISFKTIVQIIVGLIILFIIWYILVHKWIYIYIHNEKSKYKSYLFSIIVSMTFLLFQLACGFDIRTSNPYVRFIFIGIIITIVYYGFQNYGLGFKIYKNFGLLYHITYESNTKEGLLFFTRNFLFWTYIYIASLILMTRDD